MRLSFVGMSGIGKSHWSSLLVERGFKCFCCDDFIANLIAEKLASELISPDGSKKSIGEWMGFPYEPQFKRCQEKYLTYEAEVLDKTLTHLETDDDLGDVIIDNTGSVIYTRQDLLERLAQQTTIIYLDTPLEIQTKLHAAYCANPRPIIWLDKFNKKPEETKQEALARCYPQLLASRVIIYKQWADITLDYYQLRQNDFTIDDFVAKIDLAMRQGI